MPVTTHVLLTGVQTGRWDLSAAAVEALALGAYAVGVARLARRGRRWPMRCSGAFAAGTVTLWIAVGSGLAAFDESSVVIHVVQHVLLMMVAPPLIALGRPLTLASQAAARPTQSRLARLRHRPVVRALTGAPVGWGLFAGSMLVYFGWARVYDLTIAHPLLHAGSHLLFFAIGGLFWSSVLDPEPVGRRLSHPARIGLMLAVMPADLLIGLSLLVRHRPIDALNSLSGTHAAGLTFWILAMLSTAVWVAVVGLQWMADADRRTPLEDRRAAERARQSAQRADELGLADLPAGWTLPAWRLGAAPAAPGLPAAGRPDRR